MGVIRKTNDYILYEDNGWKCSLTHWYSTFEERIFTGVTLEINGRIVLCEGYTELELSEREARRVIQECELLFREQTFQKKLRESLGIGLKAGAHAE